MSNLILAVSSGFSTGHLWPFVDSFNKCREKSSALIVFVNRSKFIPFGQGKPLNKATEKFLLEQTDELIGFKCMSLRQRRPVCLLWPLCKQILLHLKSDEQRRQFGAKVVSLVFLRFILYLDYLESLKEKPQWVLLTDSRDVIFQKDIFSGLSEHGLYCFLEEKNLTIGRSSHNTMMIRNCFGEEALKQVSQFRVSCSGTVLGDYQSIINYLRTFVEYTFKVQKMCMCGGDDQGLHNYLIHNQIISGVKLVDNAAGPIATLGAVPAAEIHRSSDHLILQPDGRPYALIHQYDRHRFIVESHPACQTRPQAPYI
jgi:hypothetical protein